MTDAGSLLKAVHDNLAADGVAASVEHLTVGDNLVYVECNDGSEDVLAGVAHRPPGEASEVPDGTESSALELGRWAFEGDTPIDRALGVAALNAVSIPRMRWQSGDPMAAVAGDVDTIATVGLFRPAFRKFDAVDVRVVERDPSTIDPGEIDTPTGVSVTVFGPEDARDAFTGAALFHHTGSSLVYGGFERYLAAATHAPVVLIGATASFLPGPVFNAGVDVVAGARVRNCERVRTAVAAGACTTDIPGSALEKVYVARDADLSGLTLPSEHDEPTVTEKATTDQTTATDQPTTTNQTTTDQSTANETHSGGHNSDS